MRKYLSECHFGVLPFIQVPADRPISFLEFFTAGKPVVALDTPGITELIGDERGMVVSREDVHFLADALKKMAEKEESDFDVYRNACLNYMRLYPQWCDSVNQVVDLLDQVAIPTS